MLSFNFIKYRKYRSIFVDNLANGKDEKGAVKTRHMERRRKKMNGQEEQQQQQEEEYGGSLALIPLVDLFNHRPNAQVTIDIYIIAIII